MEVITIIGGVKSEPLENKVKRETVEIGIDDICDSSEEENTPNIENKNVKQIVLREERTEEVFALGELNDKSLLDKGIKQDHEDFNTVDNLESSEKLVLNFGDSVSDIAIKSKRSVNSSGVNWAEVYRTCETTNTKEDELKVKVTEAPRTNAIVAPHEYTSLASNKHICNHCQHASRCLRKLKHHIRIHHREVTKMYYCPYCPYKSKWELRSHIILKHKDDKDIHWFTCYICNMKFKLKTHLAVHIYSHFPPEYFPDRRKECSICNRTFNNTNAVRRHVKSFHNKEKKKKLQCGLCEYKTTIHRDMKNHFEVHHTAADKLQEYKCSKCDYKSKYITPFQRHVMRHNSHHICETCGYLARDTCKLKLHQIAHQQKVDDKDLKFRCNKCDYKTYRQYNLQIHQLNHLKPHEVKYFYCYHCNFKAKRKDNLKTHVLRHFKKEEVVLKCYLCRFSTKKRNLLTNHISKHSKEKTEPKEST